MGSIFFVRKSLPSIDLNASDTESAVLYGRGMPSWSQIVGAVVSLISRCLETAAQRPLAGLR